MYNSDFSNQNQPSAAQLVRSTIVAFIVAMILLVCVVLPSEYAVDPTGAGRFLGLTEMGEIKTQLAEEAAADAAGTEAVIAAPVIATAAAAEIKTQEVTVVVQPEPKPAPKPVVVSKPEPVKVAVAPQPEPAKAAVKAESTSFILKPGQGAEIKLEMKQDATVQYSWTANGGKLNYDTHGDPYNAPKGFYHGYGKGRFVPGDSGSLKAAFDGKHGWFWRNRTKKDVTLTLEVSGDYINLKRVI